MACAGDSLTARRTEVQTPSNAEPPLTPTASKTIRASSEYSNSANRKKRA
jgi:hypothetical protein